MFDLTHDIPNYDIWEAAYRLEQTAKYWPKGTVFVCVVDPGVGTNRKSVVLQTKTGHFFVTPDNGTLTLVAESMGIKEVRQIDEVENRRANTQESYTFYGRDVYAYTGARLASGKITFEQVGKKLKSEVEKIPYQKAEFKDGAVLGMIPVLDVEYGNIWTNIDEENFGKLGVKKGDILNVKIYNENKLVYEGKIPYVDTFGDVPEGKPLLYFNSLMNVSFAINMDNFAETHNVDSGSAWSVRITK